jgi:hypothetical protein
MGPVVRSDRLPGAFRARRRLFRWRPLCTARWFLVAAIVALQSLLLPAAWAQNAELLSFHLVRQDGELTVEFSTRVNLPRAVEDALQRGVPVYFVARADLYRSRWYWRDQRVARVQRSWRLAYQPITSSWRVSLSGLNQSYPTLAEALASMTRSTGWRLVDLQQIDSDSSYYVEFSYRLDTTQLPSPMQIGIGGQADWTVQVERSLKLD